MIIKKKNQVLFNVPLSLMHASLFNRLAGITLPEV